MSRTFLGTPFSNEWSRLRKLPIEKLLREIVPAVLRLSTDASFSLTSENAI